MKLKWVKNNTGGRKDLICILPVILFSEEQDNYMDEKVRIDYDNIDGIDIFCLYMPNFTYECDTLKEAKSIAITEIKKEIKKVKKQLSSINLSKLK